MTIREMKNKSAELGSHWFSPGNMAFFGTEIETEPNYNNVFITSEQDNGGVVWDGERRYTVRQFDDTTGNCDDLSDFGEFETLEEALCSAIYREYA